MFPCYALCSAHRVQLMNAGPKLKSLILICQHVATFFSDKVRTIGSCDFSQVLSRLYGSRNIHKMFLKLCRKVRSTNLCHATGYVQIWPCCVTYDTSSLLKCTFLVCSDTDNPIMTLNNTKWKNTVSVTILHPNLNIIVWVEQQEIFKF